MMFFNNRPIGSASSSVEVEHDGLALAMHESFCDFEADIKGAIPKALSNVYEMYITDTTHTVEQKTAVLEGVMGDAWEKIKAFFKKIAEKLKSWWNAALKYFQTIFSSNKSFLEKFKEDISGKDGSKFSYTGYTYDSKKSGEVMKKVNTAVKDAEGVFDRLSKLTDSEAEKVDENVKNEKKSIDKTWLGLIKDNVESGNVSKFKEALKKDWRGSKDKQEIKGFKKGLSVSEMITLMEDGGDMVTNLKETADNIASASEDYADKVDSMVGKFRASEEDATKRANYSKIVTGASTVAKYTLSYATAALDVMKSETQEMISQSSSVLRSFARYKPAKESYAPSTGNHTSLLETYAAGF